MTKTFYTTRINAQCDYYERKIEMAYTRKEKYVLWRERCAVLKQIESIAWADPELDSADISEIQDVVEDYMRKKESF